MNSLFGLGGNKLPISGLFGLGGRNDSNNRPVSGPNEEILKALSSEPNQFIKDLSDPGTQIFVSALSKE